jgi:predicted PurR-regulated permease PerM
MKLKIPVLIIGLIFLSSLIVAESGFSEQDRERLIRVETTLKVFMEQVDKRLTELREDMNKRFEQVDKRFEQFDSRFGQVDSRFGQMMNFLGILAAIFTALTLGVIAFAYWDRRTIIRRAKEETIAEIEKEGRLRDLIYSLRELSKEDDKIAQVLKSFHLL